MIVARYGHTDIVEQLIDQHHAAVDHKNHIGNTALYLATENGHTHTVASLANRGADINVANIGGWTPILMASAQGDLATMSLLIEQGANVNVRNRWGQTALSEAQRSFRAQQAVALLIAAGAQE